MTTKKFLALLLALGMTIVVMTGCDSSRAPDPSAAPEPKTTAPTTVQAPETQPADTSDSAPETAPVSDAASLSEVYDPGTALSWSTEEVTNEGHGRTLITLPNGISFRVGDTVQELIAAGLEFDEDELSTTLAPWAHADPFVYYDKEDFSGFSIDVINDSAEPRLIADCRSYYFSLDDEGTYLENGIAVGQTTEEAMALCGTDDANNLILGNEVNGIEAAAYNGVVFRVDVWYIDHIFDPYFYTEEDVEVDSMVLSAMSHYMDVSPYENHYHSVDDLAPLNEVLEDDEMRISVDGLHLQLGPGGTTLQDLVTAGWAVRELDEDHQQLDPGYYLTMILSPVSIADTYKISSVSVTNYTEETMDTMSCALQDITLENPKYFATDNRYAAPFDMYGITADSTIQDILRIFGMPDHFNTYLPNCTVTLNYTFRSASDGIHGVTVVFDFMTNQLIEITI